MKRLLSLSLLALPLLFLACDNSQTSTGPDETDSQALLGEVAPLGGGLPSPLVINCSGTTCIHSGDDFYSNGGTVNINYYVCPADKGTITVYDCHDRQTNLWAPKEACLNKGGGGRWVLYDTYDVGVYTCSRTFATIYGTSPTQGWKVKYAAKGSGYKSSTVYANTYPGSP